MSGYKTTDFLHTATFRFGRCSGAIKQIDGCQRSAWWLLVGFQAPEFQWRQPWPPRGEPATWNPGSRCLVV